MESRKSVSAAGGSPPHPPKPSLLTLVTREFQGQPMWAVDHPEHGELLMAKHVLHALEYDEATIKANGTSTLLSHAGISPSERVHLKHRDLDHRSIPSTVTLTGRQVYAFSRSGANFLGRPAVRKLVMASTKPKAKEFREWLADVSIKVEDTGGYLLNEAARDTAFADTRTTVPLPSAIAGGYEALIEARRAIPHPMTLVDYPTP